MVRKLAPALALVLMALSVTALGLGLGDIHTRSALNQNFSADIRLLSVDPAEIDSLRVTLASPEAFERAGVDRPFFLAGLKFTPMLNESGKPVIRITSSNPIREPFLNFLVEVNWPKGRLVREYTVLLDPPTTLNRRPPEVSRAVAAPTQATAVPAPAPVAAAPAAMPDQYGPVQDSETLWSIGRKLRLDGASIAQTVMAIYKANPTAFQKGDINGLMRGSILRVPSRDEVMALTHREAAAAFKAAQDASLASRSSKTETPTAVTEEAAAPVTAAPAESAAVEEAQLRIATPRPEGEGQAGAGEDDATGETSAELKNALMLSREEAETARQESEYLRHRVESMEQQVELLKQRLVNVKDEELAQLQAQVSKEPGSEPEATPVAGEPAAEAAAATAAAAPEPAPAAEPQPVVQEPTPAPRREPGIFDMLAGNTTLVGGGVAAVLALVVLLLMLRRRGKAAADSQADAEADDLLEESILMEVEGPRGSEDFAGEGAAAGNDTSFLSEFSPSDLHTLAEDTSEVDPVSEADVYIAYGRYEQAEELLRQALRREPERMALKFKLLEVYYANRNAAAYSACAQELADAGQDGVDPEAWRHVCEMGRELAPDYPLFAAAAMGDDPMPDSAAGQPAGIDTLSELNADSVLEIPTDAAAQAEAANEEGPETGPESVLQSGYEPAEPAGAETEMDLTLDLDDLSMPQSVVQDESSLEGLESIDLELPDLDNDPARKQTVSDASDDSLILELDADAGSSVVADEVDPESLQAQLDELSDLADLEDELSQLTAEIDDLDKPLSLDEAYQQMATGTASEEAEIPAPFQEQMVDTDEVQTKLDLAIAFVEMGDKEGARSILDEVCDEGSDEQRAQAEKLLADMSA